MMTLDEAIEYELKMSQERYLNDGTHKQYYEWLKELKMSREYLDYLNKKALLENVYGIKEVADEACD